MHLEVMLHNIYINILQQIFKEHYEELIYLLNPRKSIIQNVDRMIHCGDSSFGVALFDCEHCSNLKFVPFRCKSRFCPSCGTKYAIDRTTAMSFKLVNCIHRQCVFTIDENLRIFFYEDRSLLNCLFSAVRSTREVVTSYAAQYTVNRDTLSVQVRKATDKIQFSLNEYGSKYSLREWASNIIYYQRIIVYKWI